MNVKEWLKNHNFNSDVDVEKVTADILSDMEDGLSGKKSYQEMIKTWMLPKEMPKNEKAIVIDAGGTNFRSCLVSFDGEGKPEISELEKTQMPGFEREYSKKEFFAQIAENLEHLKNKAEKIGFCFSYPMEITKDGDGICGKLTKEIKAHEVEGCHIGKELKAELEARGWNTVKKISLVNDTVSALLAGATLPKKYSSHIGFILGTGMNIAYIEKFGDGVAEHCRSTTTEGLEVSQIIDCETGRFCNIPLSDFDKSRDEKTEYPGVSMIEKSCSGGYLPALVAEIYDFAVKEGIASPPAVAEPVVGEHCRTIEATGKILSMAELAEVTDPILKEIFSEVVKRAALFASSIISAAAIKSAEGKDDPICIVCNGTTFYKTPNLRATVEASLEKTLGSRGIKYEIVTVENDITLGTAVASL